MTGSEQSSGIGRSREPRRPFWLQRPVAVWVIAGSAAGCVAAATAPPTRVVVVTGPPPAPIVEEITPQPQPKSIWIAGYWHWNGIQYAWIPGHWEAARRDGATWRAPRYVRNDAVYFYEPGTWWTAVAPSGGLAPATPASVDPGGAKAFR